jgi:hypothetical protein
MDKAVFFDASGHGRGSVGGIGGVSASALWQPEPGARRLPVGLQLISVRDVLAKDLMGTIRAVAAMGYEVVEFYAPYAAWSPAQAKEVRATLDDLKITCPRRTWPGQSRGRRLKTGDRADRYWARRPW